ncbi:M-phase inducer phosphatase [Rhypophila decipiens]|uniref:M-phase inducer phosphatase n=1 Tax=Rhypophila decipiens TaxID=261697 RepID=A0AAN7BAV7_9PEZI|nr:M-phase inducer phosphatase [Rhypophila decipiens]
METSSPLAALRPAFGQRDIFGAHGGLLSATSLGGGLHDQYSFQRPNPEYFNLKTVRGSSPAASLAADLSQNFKLNDATSPMFPTPRRALFTTATMMGSLDGRDYVTTPPLPASSPGDMMDMSPLPHKAPYVAHVEVLSPTPNTMSPADDMMLESPIPAPTSRPSLMADRRKLGLRRPSLNRSKGYSTGGILTSRRLSNGENQLPPFRFGGESPPTPSTSMSLDECFEDSPPQERRPQSANSPCPPAMGGMRQKAQFASLSGASSSVRNGSPISSHSRRTSNPFVRPRKQYRRSLSMFESPGDVMKPKKEEEAACTLQAVMDIEEPHEPILPHFFPEGQNDSIPRISRETMLEVLDGKYGENYAHKMIIDCRFEYEYEGGHIDGAINYNDKELLATHLFHTPIQGRTLLIFHCEYSAHRAPIMARHIRAQDRAVNAEHYPRLTYPEVYILEGGYSGFFQEHRDRCYPQAYVEMNDASHANTCEREMGRLRNRQPQNRRGLGRAATYAFGQQRSIEDSPTAPGRGSSRECDNELLGASPILGNDRGHARRMVSF